MSSTCFEPDGSSPCGRLYMQFRYGTVYIHRYKQCSE